MQADDQTCSKHEQGNTSYVSHANHDLPKLPYILLATGIPHPHLPLPSLYFITAFIEQHQNLYYTPLHIGLVL